MRLALIASVGVCNLTVRSALRIKSSGLRLAAGETLFIIGKREREREREENHDTATYMLVLGRYLKVDSNFNEMCILQIMPSVRYA